MSVMDDKGPDQPAHPACCLLLSDYRLHGCGTYQRPVTARNEQVGLFLPCSHTTQSPFSYDMTHLLTFGSYPG